MPRFSEAPSDDGVDFWQWCDSEGRPAPAPEAWASGWLRLISQADLEHDWAHNWEELSLWRDQTPLPLLLSKQRGQKMLLASWPASNAGFCRLTLKQQQQTLATGRLFVGARHLNQQQWLDLLTDLRYRLPARLLLQLGSTTFTPVKPAAVARDPDEELLILHQWLEPKTGEPQSGEPGLLAALGWLRNHARRQPVLTGQWRPLARTRQLSPSQLSRSFSTGLQAQTPIWEQRAGLSLDLPENQFVTGLIQSIQSRLQQLQLYLLRSGRFELEQRTAVLSQRLDQHWQNHPLSQLSPRWQAPEQTQLMRLPAYRVCLKIWRDLRQGYLPGLNGLFELPLADLALLYQHHCLLETADALLSWGKTHGWQADSASKPPSLKLRRGQALIRLHYQDLELELIPERSYGQSGELISLSQSQRPDASLILRRGSEILSLIVLEAKFRAEDNQPLKADLDKLHAYRDAIRFANGQAAVSRAVLLYPGAFRHYLPALEAWQVLPGQTQTIHLALNQLLADVFKPD